MSGTRQKEVQLLQLETGSGEVVKKYRDIAAIFMLTVLLPDSSSKRRGYLTVKNGQGVRQTKCPHLSSEEGEMRLGGKAGRKRCINWKTNMNENPRFYYKNMKTWRGGKINK